MMTIAKIKLHNFKRFKDLFFDVNPDINIFIGDNESGKSTILQAIDIVARGSRTRIENIGLDKLFNIEAIREYMNGDRDLNKMPEMYVELYFPDQPDPSLEGMNNSKRNLCSGIRLCCIPNDEYSQQIAQLLQNPNASFPLEFYKIVFETFAGESFNAYTKRLSCIFVDNSTIGSPRAMRDYVSDIYHVQLTDEQRINARYAYKNNKVQFQNQILAQYNALIPPYSFAIRESADDNIETDITLLENDIPLENKGTGTQCFIKTELSINRAVSSIDAVLIEEPENHLSYTKMLELIELIRGSQNRQLFISTHCDLIATRLNLKKCLLFNSLSTNVVSLGNLPDDTADFFIKAPDNNMLQFVLSPKSILVEGDAEFILMEALYKRTIAKELSSSGIGVIAVGGKCFKRYLDIAKLLNNKVAVITDNDHDYAVNVTNNYSDYIQNQFANIKIYSDANNERNTFEVCIYQDNQAICDSEFQTPGRRLATVDFMLKNKAEAAYLLQKNKADTIVVPQYIQDAITWIDA
ncbi:ATP-dependent nuclease [Proteiniphilum propionicum]|uniref:ATP-dependent nuclease n=1 Tax=Proteiniphilum propionicum TaxID=2829812 RepID=UPI001EEC549B|nr:AAA family ATPase [Proteiniphilum propionicum]ULB34337.1 AAA family ATPase [Proteiniphilum propionicum]